MKNCKEGGYVSNRQAATYDVIKDFLARKITKAQAAQLLDKSPRTITRLARKVEKDGLLGLLHGNTGKAPKVKKDLFTKAKALRLYQQLYYDFNIAHAQEMLEKEHGLTVAYRTLHRWCQEKGLVARKKHRRRKVRKLRERMVAEGMMVQLDGSFERWNRVSEWCLIGVIDDATSEIGAGQFFADGETSLAVMTVMRRLIEKKGIPRAVYVDHAAWAKGDASEMAQFQRACQELGITVIHANSPQAKGRIERAWGTVQDRLIPEMRHKGVRTLAEANRYWDEVFVPEYWNRRNTVAPRLRESYYRPVPEGIDLVETFCVKETRKVKGDHTISWNGQEYVLEGEAMGLTISLKGREVELRTYADGTTKAWYFGYELRMTAANKPQRGGRGAA